MRATTANRLKILPIITAMTGKENGQMAVFEFQYNFVCIFTAKEKQLIKQ